MVVHDHNRQVISQFRDALYNLDKDRIAEQLAAFFVADASVQLGFPHGKMQGPNALYENAYAPLIEAIPDLERRDYMVLAGEDEGENWVACAGYYTGVFERPWLNIPATQHIVTLRYCEFFRIEGEKIAAMHGLWDIPELMLQAKAWPLAPSLGKTLYAPAPATNDGIVAPPHCASSSAASLQLVNDMLTGLSKYKEGGVEAMQLERYWHPKMNWYGPAGIGANRRISGFRAWHQKPFLAALPDRGSFKQRSARQCFFGDGDYVAFCGFNSMYMTVSGDGWLGIAPSNKKITMTTLDFWRSENGMLRENWVLIDLLDVYRQLGVDVFQRMRECTVDRQ